MSSASYSDPMRERDFRARLPDVPDVGRVTRLRGKLVLDFSPELRGTSRYLYTLSGKAFESEEIAESVRIRICHNSETMSLEDAVARYRGKRSQSHKATKIIDRYLEAAPTLQSDQTGRFLSPRTLAAYAGVLRRARPFFGDLTIAEATSPRVLRNFKAWFRLPSPAGRGLKSDQEARAAFGAFRAVVAWYRLERPDFPAPDWPTMPTALKAKRQNEAERNRTRITIPEVVRAIEEIPAKRRAIFWIMFYCGARPTEARGVLVSDWERPRLTIRRSAESKKGGCAVLPTTKTGETGAYDLPEWLCDLIDETTREARLSPEKVLFQNPSPLAARGVISDDALRDAWVAACDRVGVPFVPLYRATKHTPFSALRNSGISLEELIPLYRWTGPASSEHYDERQDERRGAVVVRLDAIVSKAKKDESEK